MCRVRLSVSFPWWKKKKKTPNLLDKCDVWGNSDSGQGWEKRASPGWGAAGVNTPHTHPDPSRGARGAPETRGKI